jgi:hypothetical protein
MNRRYIVTLVCVRRVTVGAGTPEAAEAVALAEHMARWPSLTWLVSDTEEEL